MLARDLRRRRRAGARSRRDPRRRPHDPRRRAEVRARGRRHGASGRRSGRRAARAPGDALFLTKPLGTGLVLRARTRGPAARGALDGGRADDGRSTATRPTRCGRSSRTPSPTSPASGCSATRTRWPSGAACGSRSTPRRCPRSRARSRPRAPGCAPAATAATASSPGRTSRPTASPEELLALGYDPQTAGGLLVSLPADKGARARGRVRGARALPRAHRPRRARAPASRLAPASLGSCTSSRRRRAVRAFALAPSAFRASRSSRRALADRRTGATVRLTGSGLGCRALARLREGRVRCPRAATTRTSSSGTASSALVTIARRHADRLASRRWRTPRPAAAVAAARARRLPRHARAGAARRDSRSDST